MKKYFYILSALAVTGIILTGCSKNKAEGRQAANVSEGAATTAADAPKVTVNTTVTSADKFTIRLAYDVPEAHPSHRATVEVFKAMMEQGSNGNITVELYPNSQLGSLAENMESMRIGDLEMAYLNDGTIAASVPEFNLVGLPYLWTSIDAAHAALDGEFGSRLNQKLLDTCGLINLGYADVGFRNITNTKRAVKTPQDLSGLKIRTMTNTLHVDYFSHLGAIPTPMSFSELFTALQQKTVDGQENPTALIYNNKLYEVQKYMTVSEHVWTSCPLTVSGSFYSKLPEDYQKLLIEAANATVKAQREYITEQNASLAKDIEAAGVEVIYLTEEEKALFQKAAEESVYVTAAEKYGQELIDLAASFN